MTDLLEAFGLGIIKAFGTAFHYIFLVVSTPFVYLYKGARAVVRGVARAAAALYRRIVGDERFFTGRLARSLKNIFFTLRHHPSSIFSVLAYYAKRGLKQYRKLGRYVALLAIPVLLGVGVFIVAHHYASLNRAMRVDVGGVTVGYVADGEEYKAARALAVEMLSNALSDADERLPQGDLVSEFVPADSFTPASEIARSIVSLSDVVTKPACGVYVDGNFLCAVEFESDARAALMCLLYEKTPDSADGAVSFVESVTLEQGLYPEGVQLYSSEALYEKLKNAKRSDFFHLTMKYVKTEVSNVDTDYDTVEIPSDNMYIGASRTVVNGKKGYDQITNLVTYVDGKKVSSSEVSRLTVVEPVTERVQVGTRALDEGYQMNTSSGGLLLWPALGPDQINSDYEWRWGKLHAAIDIGSSGSASSYGKTIIAAAEGTVVIAGVHSSYGYYVRIDHGNGMETLYAHCMAGSLMVSPGEHVYAGQPIARVGQTGYATGPHLHFEVIINGTRVDPKPYLGITR